MDLAELGGYLISLAVGLGLGYFIRGNPATVAKVGGTLKTGAGNVFGRLWARLRKKPSPTPAEPATFTVDASKVPAGGVWVAGDPERVVIPVGPGARKTREQADLEARLALAKKVTTQ